MSYLIDTNVINELVREKPNKKVIEWFETIPSEATFISVLTLGEIRKGIEKIEPTRHQLKLRTWLEVELPNWFQERILPIDSPVANRWGLLQAQMKRPLPAIDSLIAATALHHDLSVVTRNENDFNYPLLQVINPWSY
jgi:predicted nucleic acid-binding protein